MKRVAILVLGGCDPRRLRENDGRRDDADGQVVTAGDEGMLDTGMMKDDQGTTVGNPASVVRQLRAAIEAPGVRMERLKAEPEQLGRLVGARAAMVGDGS